ncbi:MAG: BON domain-containing protein [Acidobacteriota bacterium]
MKLIYCTVLAAGVLMAQAPDNTKVNRRDKTSTPVTADQQGTSAQDIALTKKIRESLIAEKGLSTYAKNIKVISMNGEVTLRGPVRSSSEKELIMKKAMDVAGPTHVMNHLDVTPTK